MPGDSDLFDVTLDSPWELTVDSSLAGANFDALFPDRQKSWECGVQATGVMTKQNTPLG